MQSLRKFSIRQRLLSSTVAMGVAMVVMLLAMLDQSEDLTDLATASKLASTLEADVLTLRRHEKDFLLRRNAEYVDKHQKSTQVLLDHVAKLTSLLQDNDLDSRLLGNFRQQVDEYQQSFQALAATRKEIGLTDEEGLIGAMRKAAHAIENDLKDKNDATLTVQLLQIRRYEKDFRLSPDVKFQTLVETTVSELRPALDATSQQHLDEYQATFRALVNAEQKSGLSPDQGLMGSMREEIKATESILEQLAHDMDEAIQSETDRVKFVGIAISLTTLILLTGFVILIGRSIIVPVTQVQQTLNAVTRDRDFRFRLDVSGHDEMSALGNDVNTLLSEVQHLIKTVNTALSMLDLATAELSEATTITSRDMQQQQVETDLVATAVTEMGSTIHEIASNTESTAARAESTNAHANRGQKQVASAVQQIRQLSTRLERATDTVNELAKDSQTIGQVLEVIRTIADQTNLLALNAAIEAARAGEQGRGFAVVADEVRMLAMKTQESTKQIEGIIRGLQSRTLDIVRVMQECRDDGVQSASQAGEAMQVLDEITSNVTEIKDMTITIAAAIEEQSLVAQEVNKNVVRIRDLSIETAETSAKNAEISEEVSSQASELQRSVEAFKA
ncbi:MAG TPA: methyl-accepting chemotaxis protein [Rheinheimera sp.]|nr:methyl-accepting chemotaxis protein [Rheinheimera sp.]